MDIMAILTLKVILTLLLLYFKLAFLNQLHYDRIWCCWQVGITIAARKYDLDSASPFQTADILNLQPVVKHSVPVCSEAKDLVETGKVQLAEVCTLLCSLHSQHELIFSGVGIAWNDWSHNSVKHCIRNTFRTNLCYSFSRRKKCSHWIIWYLFQGMLTEAYTLFSEAFSILQQVCYSIFLPFWTSSICKLSCLFYNSMQVTGPMHREVANCCR